MNREPETRIEFWREDGALVVECAGLEYGRVRFHPQCDAGELRSALHQVLTAACDPNGGVVDVAFRSPIDREALP